MPCTNELSLGIAVSHISFLKPNEKEILIKNIDNIKDLALLSIKDISNIVGRTIKSRIWFPDRLEEQVAYSLKIMQAYKIRCCFRNDECYPVLLKEIFDPPFMLFWRGDIECVRRKTVAVVGTRRATVQGLKVAFEISKELAERDITVVSGLALGIDGSAHKGALSASFPDDIYRIGKTCAVLACGVENIYPASHRRLAGMIIEKGGCILSEYPPGWQPQKWCFPARNRIISGLSSITAIIEAPAGSGALITADFAIEQGRELVFHVCGVNRKQMELTESKKMDINQYVSDGAPVIQNADEIIAVLNSNHVMYRSLKIQEEFDFKT